MFAVPGSRVGATGAFSCGSRSRYQAPPQPTAPPPGADDAYPDPADLAYRGRARHIAGWDFEHSAHVMLIDKQGTQRIGIPFESLTPKSLAADMRARLAEP